MSFAIFSHVRLQSKNISPNRTSFVVETVNPKKLGIYHMILLTYKMKISKSLDTEYLKV